ncbi:hypothetical protein EJ02DRAFT_314500, partial [Clathrospora elynae]
LILTLCLIATVSSGSTTPGLELSDITYSSYYTFVSPSASGPKAGTISFTVANNRTDDPIECKGVNSNPFANFYGSTVYDCITSGKEEEKANAEDCHVCWTDSMSFSFDTTVAGTRNLTVNMIWTCADEGVYSLSAWSLLNFSCEKWTCTNNLWSLETNLLYSNTTTVCAPTKLSFSISDVKVVK